MDHSPTSALIAHGIAAVMALMIALFETPQSVLSVFREPDQAAHPAFDFHALQTVPVSFDASCNGDFIDAMRQIDANCALEIAQFLGHPEQISAMATRQEVNPEHARLLAAQACREVWRAGKEDHFFLPACIAVAQPVASQD